MRSQALARYVDLMSRLLVLSLAVALGGCVRTVADVVTFPVKAAAQGVDWATTSQDESDRNRGRRIRKAEEREAKEARKAAKVAARERRHEE